MKTISIMPYLVGLLLLLAIIAIDLSAIEALFGDGKKSAVVGILLILSSLYWLVSLYVLQ